MQPAPFVRSHAPIERCRGWWTPKKTSVGARICGATLQRRRDDERGREPGQDRNPRGGRPYKRAYGEPEPKAQSNFTDPESQIMKTSSEGFQQCYKQGRGLGIRPTTTRFRSV